MADFSRAVSSMAIAIVREAASRISSRGNLAIVKQIDIGRRRKVPCRISFLYGVHEYGEPCTCVYIRVISESERVGVTRGLLARELPPERPPCRRWNQGSRPGKRGILDYRMPTTGFQNCFEPVSKLSGRENLFRFEDQTGLCNLL